MEGCQKGHKPQCSWPPTDAIIWT